MALGFFTLAGDAPPGASDALLADLAARLAQGGLRVAGAVQINTSTKAREALRAGIAPDPDDICDMDLAVLGDDGPAIRISQSLGPGSSGCRLDTGALQLAAGRVAARLDQGADLVILTKFGKQEAFGRGFRDVIGQALGAGLPVLLHVGPDQRAAFDDFAAGMAEELHPEAIEDWCRAMVAGAPA